MDPITSVALIKLAIHLVNKIAFFNRSVTNLLEFSPELYTFL